MLEAAAVGYAFQKLADLGIDTVRSHFSSGPLSWEAGIASEVRSIASLGVSEAEASAIERWLGRGDVRAYIFGQTDAERAVEGVVEPLRHELGDLAGDRATELATQVVVRLVSLVDPVLAAVLASRDLNVEGIANVLAKLDELLDGQAATHAGQAAIFAAAGGEDALTGSGGDSPLVADCAAVLPRRARELLFHLAESDEAASIQIARWLGVAPGVHAEHAKALVDETPTWALVAPADAWELIGAVLSAHREYNAASSAYGVAADASPASRNWFRCLQILNLSAAGADPPAWTDDVLEAAGDFGTLLRAALRSDAEELVGLQPLLGSLTGAAAFLATSWVAGAHLAQGGGGKAVRLLDGLPDLVEESEELTVQLAQGLLLRSGGETAVNRADDVERALRLGLEARDRFRMWAGDSSRAVSVVCQAYMLRHDYEAVISSGKEEIEIGRGVGVELSAVRQFVTFASGLLGQTTEAEGEFERHWLAAMVNNGEPSGADAVVETLLHAMEVAQSPMELEFCLRSLASYGVVGDRLDELDPARAAALRGLALVRSANSADALAVVRPHVHSDRFAAQVESMAMADLGDAEAGARSLVESARRFSEPAMAMTAVAVLIQDRQLDSALELADEVLSGSLLPEYLECELTLMALDLAGRLDQVQRVRELSGRAVREGWGGERARWALVESLLRLAEYDAAARALDEPSRLAPHSEEQARLALHTLYRSDVASLSDVLAVLDEFPNSEQVVGLAILMQLRLAEAAAAATDQELARFRAHMEQFFDAFPDSSLVRAVALPDDPDELYEFVGAQMLPSEEERRAQRQLGLQLSSGQLPAGFFRERFGVDSVDFYLRRPWLDFPTSTPDSEEFDSLVDVAARGLGTGGFVCDLSVLAVAARHELPFDAAVAAGATLRLPVNSFHQFDADRRSTPPAGQFAGVGESDWFFAGPDQEERDRAAERVALAVSKIEAFARVAIPPEARELEALTELEGDATWADPLRLALALDLPLWTDDVALGRLALHLGIEWCNSLAIEVASNPETSPREAIPRWLEAGLFDLPFSIGLQLECLARLGWPAQLNRSFFGRPHVWTSLDSAVDALGAAIQSVVAADLAGLGPLVVASAHGRSDLGEISFEQALVDSMLVALARTALDPEALAAMLPLCRVAASVEHSGDPLVPAMKELAAALEALSPGELARAIAGLVSVLDPADRETVVRDVILQPR